jgi:hypothetical protein
MGGDMKILVIRSVSVSEYKTIMPSILAKYKNEKITVLTTERSANDIMEMYPVELIRYQAPYLSIMTLGIPLLIRLYWERFNKVIILYKGDFRQDYKKIKHLALMICLGNVKALNATGECIDMCLYEEIKEKFMWGAYFLIWLWLAIFRRRKN